MNFKEQRILNELIDLGKKLDCEKPKKERLEYLTKDISVEMDCEKFLKAKNWLHKNWTYTRFPSRLADYFNALKKIREDIVPVLNQHAKYEQWQYEYAQKLGIPVEQLPSHVDDLPEKQRIILNIPNKKERDLMFKVIYAHLDRIKSMKLT